MMNREKSNVVRFIIAFLAGVAVAAIAICVWNGLNPTKPADATQQGSDATEATAAGTGIDYEKVFPSWEPDSESLNELVDFVAACTDKSGSDYLEPADRIAVFDVDGTILCEKAPIYIDTCLTMYRVLDDPTYSAAEEERAAMQELRISVDQLETMTPSNVWPFPSYGDLLFSVK